MKRILGVLALLCTAAVSLTLLVTGCDSPNSPDLPAQPYHLVRAYDFGGSIEDVAVRGDYVAVAQGSYGASVYRNTGADTLTHLFTYANTLGSFCTNVALDTLHSFLGVFTNPRDESHYSVFDYRIQNSDSAEIHIGTTYSGPLWDFDVWSRSDTIVFWGTDYTTSDRDLIPSGFERTSDTTAWSYYQDCAGVQPAMQPRGFAVRPSDGVVFFTAMDLGVLVFDHSTCTVMDTIGTSGLAYDCALADSVLIVADEYSVQIVRLTDPMHGELISTLNVGTSGTAHAHRLRHVTIDGNYACVSDDIDGLYVINIANPSAPQLVQLLSMHDVNRVRSDGHGNIYVACNERGFLHFSR